MENINKVHFGNVKLLYVKIFDGVEIEEKLFPTSSCNREKTGSNLVNPTHNFTYKCSGMLLRKFGCYPKELKYLFYWLKLKSCLNFLPG